MSDLSLIPEPEQPEAGRTFRLSALQKNILIVLAALADRGTQRVPTLAA